MRNNHTNHSKQLRSLPESKRLAFVILLSERLILGLLRFAEEADFDASIYQECLDIGWNSLAGTVIPINYAAKAKDCFENAPDTEQFANVATSSALNAALCIGAMMQLLADHNWYHAEEAAILARDTASLNAQLAQTAPPKSLTLQEIMEHPIVQRELQQQADDLVFLESLEIDDTQQMVNLLRKRAGAALNAD